MALSNIFREPRRELTESVIGILGVSGLLWLDYQFGCWLQAEIVAHSSYKNAAEYWSGFFIAGMVLGVIGVFVTWLLLVFAHALGEEICNFLDRRGLKLRPKRRY